MIVWHIVTLTLTLDSKNIKLKNKFENKIENEKENKEKLSPLFLNLTKMLLPLIREVINKLKEAKYFNKLDLIWEYNNIWIKEGDK